MFLKLSLSKKSRKPAHITTRKLHAPKLNKFALTGTRRKRHKQPLPFKNPSPVSNHTLAPVRKSPFQLSLPQSQNPHPAQRSHLLTLPNSPPPPSDKKCAPKQITPTAPTNTTATTLTEIPTLMQLNILHLPRYGTSSTALTIPLSSSISPPPPPPSFLADCRSSSNWYSGGLPTMPAATTQRSHNHLAF